MPLALFRYVKFVLDHCHTFDQAGSAEVLRCHDDGERSLRFDRPALEIANAIGHMPLPPYIKREDNDNDHSRYQTVWAETPGSVAAPTASLHFTNELLARIADKGIKETKVDFAVGPGTFQPVQVEDFSQHEMHKEFCICPQQAIDDIKLAASALVASLPLAPQLRARLNMPQREHGLEEFEGWTRIFSSSAIFNEGC